MTAVLRGAFARFAKTPNLLNVQANLPAIQQSCNISGKTMRGGPRPLVNPYDYKNKRYNVFKAILDKTTYRFNDNSKVYPLLFKEKQSKRYFSLVLDSSG